LTFWRYPWPMGTARRATVYFGETLRKALRLKAAETDQTISDLVNTAVPNALAEDAEDLAAFRKRAKEPTLRFEDLIRDWKRRGKLAGVVESGFHGREPIKPAGE
jgi:hypothetical protein